MICPCFAFAHTTKHNQNIATKRTHSKQKLILQENQKPPGLRMDSLNTTWKTKKNTHDTICVQYKRMTASLKGAEVKQQCVLNRSGISINFWPNLK